MAHLIELCTLVYPQTFGPKLADDFEHWSGVVLERMRAEVGDLYPAVQVPATEDVAKQAELFGGGGDPTLSVGQVDPVACIWVRTVPCRRPGCPAPVPLVRQAWLRRKGGVVAAVPESKTAIGWDGASSPGPPPATSPGRRSRPVRDRRFVSRATRPRLPITSRKWR